MTLDVLICSFNKGIVRIDDILLPPREGIHYIVSYQYTDERYLDLIPEMFRNRPDLTLYQYKGEGLSANRNLAIEKANADLVMFAEDDTRLKADTFDTIFNAFEANPNLDVAFFQATTYTGKPLKEYPEKAMVVKQMPKYSVSIIEMAFRRERVQGNLRFDERFGLGTKFLTCGEEEIWVHDALEKGLNIMYFPSKIIETSTMLKKTFIYIDAGVQRSKGALSYYMHGSRAWWICFKFAFKAASQKMCHFYPLMKHLSEGIMYMQKTK